MIFLYVEVKLLHVDSNYLVNNMTLDNIRDKSKVITVRFARKLKNHIYLSNRVNKRFIVRYSPLMIMLLLPIAILGPLLTRGYILHYDMVFAPYVHVNIESIREGYGLYQSLPLDALLRRFSFVIPMDIVQKLVLFMIFFLSAFAMYRSVPVTSSAARLFAGVIYTVNPFTYDRFMAGHWRFLLAYSITPLVMRAFYDLYTDPGRRHLTGAILLWSLAILLNSHHMVILGLLFVCFGFVFVRRRRAMLYAAGTIAGVLLINMWWIIPGLNASGAAGNFSVEHFYAFTTRTDMAHGIWFNMLSLLGFWHQGWHSIKDYFALWPLLVFVWLTPVFVGLGAIKGYGQKHQKLAVGLILASFLGLIFASGPYPVFSVLNSWVYTNVPGMSGMRESQKFLALLALAYAVLAAYGFDILIQKRLKRTAVAAGIISIATTLLIALPMLWGGNGQITLTDYPRSWHRFYGHLERDGDNSTAIVLPWHLYVDSTFVNTLVANPAKAFYGDKVLQSQNMKLPGVKDSETSRHKDISVAVDKKDLRILTEVMRKIGANYIMITEVKNSDHAWLLDQPDLRIIIDDPDLIVLSLTTD